MNNVDGGMNYIHRGIYNRKFKIPGGGWNLKLETWNLEINLLRIILVHLEAEAKAFAGAVVQGVFEHFGYTHHLNAVVNRSQQIEINTIADGGFQYFFNGVPVDFGFGKIIIH